MLSRGYEIMRSGVILPSILLIAGCYMHSDSVGNSDPAMNDGGDTTDDGGPCLTEIPGAWEDVLKTSLATNMGYSYKIVRGCTSISGGVNLARSAAQMNNINVRWTVDTRSNLASVSKPITGVAMIVLLRQTGHTIEEPFLPLIRNRITGSVGKGVDRVTIANLLSMRSGMIADGSLNGDLWTFLNQYLRQDLVGTPGVTQEYSNTNFTIAQGIIEELSGQKYVEYVTQKVLLPMGIDPTLFNATPDLQRNATLSYSSTTDARVGQYWGEFDFVGPGGWIATANELSKFITGVRRQLVLTPAETDLLLNNNLGWVRFDGMYGRYYHHNGGLSNGLDPKQGLSTGIVRFPDGTDAVLLSNSPVSNIIRLMITAYETR